MKCSTLLHGKVYLWRGLSSNIALAIAMLESFVCYPSVEVCNIWIFNVLVFWMHYVDKLSLFLGDLVSINLSECMELTYSTLFTLVRNCPSLSEIKMENIGSKSVENSDSLPDFGVFPQLKHLYLAENSWLSDENIIMFASIFPNLQLLDLNSCNHISEGICQVLKRCSNIRHLNLAHCSRVNLLGVNFVVPKLEVLKLSDTKVDNETLYVISKNCCGLLELFVDGCNDVTEKGVKHVKENCSQLREHG